jgi:predicted RNA-binding protein
VYWLSVERYDNWETDKRAGFSFLGVTNRKLKLSSEMKAGDLLITYVSSGYSCFSDIREIVSDKPKISKFGLAYDEPYPYQIDTKPFIVLQEKKWIKIHDFVGKLSFLPIEKDWRQIMRNSPRKLSEEDALIIVKEIQIAASIDD